MFSKKIAASAMALTLGAGLAACSTEGDTAASATNTSTVAETATEQATATETSAVTATETSLAETAAAEGDTVEVATADGQTALVPQGVAQAMDEYAGDWGQPVSVDEVAGGWIVSYGDEQHVAWNENTGGAPIRGQISTQWLGELNAANNIGFPVAPEQELADGTGWIQEFENGTISWSQGENGIYGPTVEVN